MLPESLLVVANLNKFPGYFPGFSPTCLSMLSRSLWPGQTQRRIGKLELRLSKREGSEFKERTTEMGKWSMTEHSDSLCMHIHLQVITYCDYLVPGRCLILIIKAILAVYFYFCLQARWCLQYLVWLIISTLQASTYPRMFHFNATPG